jgi:nucleotide-binding universal stress UspA family protein
MQVFSQLEMIPNKVFMDREMQKFNIFPTNMKGPFQKIAVAIAFSPRIRALLAETARLKILWKAELSIIHVGEKTQEEEKLLQEHLQGVGLTESQDVKIFWEQGKPSEKILARCKKENVDLLIAGALKKEKLIQYYLGTVARKILRKADCSVLMLTDPRNAPLPFQNIVVNAENSNYVAEALKTAITISQTDNAQWVHVAREIKLYGLTMSASENYSEEEYEKVRNGLVQEEISSVQKLLDKIPHEGVKINIKLLSGKSGFELSKFAQRKNADLLVAGASPKRFSLFDRVFPHDLEYIFADLPCNLLVVHPRKEGNNG